jgi:hypothetical protein
MKRLVVYASVIVAVGFSSATSQSPVASPEEVARQFFKAEDEDRWLDAARLLDLKRFEAFRQRSLKGLRMPRTSWRRTAEELMRSDPEMPRAVAEYQAKQINKGFEDLDIVGSQFARVTSVDSLAALPVDEAAARWLEAQGPKWQYESALKRAPVGLPKCSVSGDSSTSVFSQFKPPQAAILGATTGADSVSYVVVGRGFFGPRLAGPELGDGMSPAVMTLVRVNGSWRIVPTGDMINFTGFGGNTTIAIGCDMERPAKARGHQPAR